MPAPLGPRTTSVSPAPRTRSTSRERRALAEVAPQAVQFDRVGHDPDCRCPRPRWRDGRAQAAPLLPFAEACVRAARPPDRRRCRRPRAPASRPTRGALPGPQRRAGVSARRSTGGPRSPSASRMRTGAWWAACAYRRRDPTASPGTRSATASRTAAGAAGGPTVCCACCCGSRRQYRAANPGAPRLTIGDLSRPHGGDFGPRFGGIGHASHQNGLDIDVYYPRLDGAERAPRRVGQIDLDSPRTSSALRRRRRPVRLRRPEHRLRGPRRVVQTLVHHDDHMHVRLRNPLPLWMRLGG